MNIPKKKDGRGGKRIGAGRKPKSDERKLVEKLGPYEDVVIDIMMEKIITNGDRDMIKLYFAYLNGTPRQYISSEVNQTMTNVELKDIISFDEDYSDDEDDNFFDDLD